MKKVLSFILALALVISIVPTAAFAAEEEVSDTPTSVRLDLTQTGFVFTDNTRPVIVDAESGARTVNSGWTTKGFSIVPEKTTTTKSRSQTSDANYLTVNGEKTSERIVRLGFSIPSRKPWPINNDVSGMFTIKTEISADGNYSMRMLGAKKNTASQFAIYVNDTYVGDYKNYGTNSSGYILDSSYTELNDIDLKKGDVEISFRIRKPYYTSGYMVPYSFELIPNDTPVTVEALENYVVVDSEDAAVENEKKLSVGTTESFKARVKMTDGNYRSFGYTNGGEIPQKEKNDDGIYIESSNPNVVEVKDVVCVEPAIYTLAEVEATIKTQEIDPTTTTYSLVAKNSGTAEIKVTAIVDGESEEETYTVTVPYTDDSDAAQENIAYIVRGSTTDFDAGIDMTGYTAGDVGSHPINTSFTAVAKEEITVSDKTYNFAYWQTAGDAPIEGAGASYTFTPKSNFTIEAVYVPAEPTTDADKKVQLWNYNRVYLGEETVTDGKVTQMPTQPTLAGHTFTGWTAENIGAFGADTQLTAALTRVVAQFTADADKYSVKVDGVEVGKYAYGASFKTTADETKDTQVFSHWAIGDKVVSYDREISFCVWNNVELTAVYADAAPAAVPTVVLDNIDDEYFITYEVPTGYTAIDAGIVFGSNDPRVDSTDGSKASVRDIKAKGQFTAMPGDSAHSVARGYVMYEVAATEEIRVIYSK